MSSPISAAADSATHDQTFNAMLTEFLGWLAGRFPANSGIAQAKMFGTMMNDPSSCAMKREGWGGFSEPVLSAIMARDVTPLSAALDAADNPIIKSMGLAEILADTTIDADTKTHLWRYVQMLSVIAHEDTGVAVPARAAEPATAPPSEMSPVAAITPVAAVAPIVPAVAAGATGAVAAAPAPAVPDVSKVIEGFAAAMPKVMESFNTMLKDNDGDNPMAQMFQQFMNPNQVQPGVMNNLAANYMESGDAAPVMAQVQQQLAGMSAQEIAAKLRRLERIESKHASKRKGGRK